MLVVQTGDIGQEAVVPPEFAGCNCHALIIVAPRRGIVSGEWISAVLCSSYGFDCLLSIQTGALHPHLNCGHVRTIQMPVPPVEEQQAILQYISAATRKLDAIASATERSMSLLKERRAALITAAVTGQVDIRGTSNANGHQQRAAVLV